MTVHLQDLLWQKKEKIVTITINRPQVMNAISPVTRRDLIAACDELERDPDLWVAILTGTGDKAFSAGNDMKWRDTNPEEFGQWEEWRKRSRLAYGHMAVTSTLSYLRPELWKPVIAAVNGYCLGGGLELAMCCDLIIAADNATFGLPEVTHGWPPGSGCFNLPRKIPRNIAMEMLLTGDRISAERAYQVGLVNKVVPAAELMDTATAYARRICENPPLGVRAVKELALRGMDMPMHYPPLVWHLFPDSVRMVEESEDRKEGRKAFAEKRKPVFKGK
jgi:enoyl-CoA hydratase/carnithine racemase